MIKIDSETTPSEVTGLVFLNANFVDNKVEGEITARFSGTNPMADLILINSDIKSDGIFAGGVEFDDNTAVGAYAGAFGGSGAQFVGGTVYSSGPNEEYGIFVIEKCGPLGTDCF